MNRQVSKLLTNRQKKDLICRWLESQGVNDFVLNMRTENHTKVDIYLPTQNIAIHLSDGHNQAFYECVKTDFRPFFVRRKETMDFVFQKLTNCIAGHSCATAKTLKKAAAASPDRHEATAVLPLGGAPADASDKPKRKRVKVTAQRVVPGKKM